MDTLHEFVETLLRHGRAVLPGRPADDEDSAGRPAERLKRAFDVYRLQIAGPPISFDARIAVAAARVVRQACWALVSRDQRVEDLATALRMPLAPTTAAQHLSADLMLRYLPLVHRRACHLEPSDPLVGLIEKLLRQWPLSGVLADLDDGPAEPPDLAGHPGLMLLYAERLAEHERPSWRPANGAMEYVELVLADLGRTRSPLLIAEGKAPHDG